MTTDTEEIVKRVRAVTQQYLGTSDISLDAMTTSNGVLRRLTELGRITEVQRNAAAKIIDPNRKLPSDL